MYSPSSPYVCILRSLDTIELTRVVVLFDEPQSEAAALLGEGWGESGRPDSSSKARDITGLIQHFTFG